MVFSTPIFLFYFLPVTLAAYYGVARRFRNLILLCASLLFYYWGEQIYVLIMFLSTAIDYSHGLMVARCQSRGNHRGARWAVASSIVFNLALLFFFKYWDFVALSLRAVGLDFLPVWKIHLPIGISFYTFQTMSYTIDVYRGDAPAQTSVVKFGTFVTLFPQLIAGPIIKYKDLGEQLDARTCSCEKFASGVELFTVGLGKKVLIANNIGLLWEAYHALPAQQLTVAGAWLGALAFAFQIYFDFSGYSDMAIGLGRMLGFEFLPNFNHPYTARSMTDFWRRWHISLGSWFREYVYFPLGGSRTGAVRRSVNLLIVWAATGLWHGASWNFVLWGMYFGVILVAEKAFLLGWLAKLPPACSHGYALFLILLSWPIFAIEDFPRLLFYLGAMFGVGDVPLLDAAFFYYCVSYLPMLTVAALAATPLGAALLHKLPTRSGQVVRTGLIAAALLLCTAYMVEGTYNPFLYFRF